MNSETPRKAERNELLTAGYGTKEVVGKEFQDVEDATVGDDNADDSEQ